MTIAPTSIRKRLMLMLSALLLLWCSIAGAMVWSIQRLQVQVVKVTEWHLPQLRRANLLVDLANDTARTMGEMLLQPELALQGISHIRAARAEVMTHMRWFHAQTNVAYDQVQMRPVNQLRLRYWDAQDRLFKLLDAEPALAKLYYLNTVIPLQREYVKAIEDISQQEDASTGESVKTIKAAYERTLYGLLLVSCVALLTAWVLGMLALRRVLVPMEAAVGLAHEVGQGHFDTVIHGEGHDEVGRLTTALQQMVVALRDDRTKREATEGALRVSQQQLRQLAVHAETLQERERLALSHELHDGMGQLLTALRMELGAMYIRFGSSNPELAQQVSHAKGLIDQIMPVMRSVVAALRPGTLDAGLLPAVRNVLERAGIETSLVGPDAELVLEPRLEMAAFRILQEALTNVVRHAQASFVSVTITRPSPETVLLCVADNGVGMCSNMDAPKLGFGLLGMRERAMQFGGDVVVTETVGGGTTVTATLHVQTPPDTTTNEAYCLDAGCVHFERAEGICSFDRLNRNAIGRAP